MDEQVLEDLENQYDNEGYYIYHHEFIKELEDKYPTYKESLLDGIDKNNIVEEEDYQDALNIMGMSSGLIGVAKGHSGNKMNEVKTHSHWAKKIIAQANVYGVRENNMEAFY